MWPARLLPRVTALVLLCAAPLLVGRAVAGDPPAAAPTVAPAVPAAPAKTAETAAEAAAVSAVLAGAAGTAGATVGNPERRFGRSRFLRGAHRIGSAQLQAREEA